MTNQHVVGIMLLLGLCLVGLQIALHVRRWRIGTAVKLEWLRGLRRLPTIYLRDVHGIVARRPEAAYMHMLVAGGLVLSLLATVLLQVLTRGRELVSSLLLISLLTFAAGILLQTKRRWPNRPARLSDAAFDHLPAALGLYCLFLLLAATPDLGWIRISPMPQTVAALGSVATVWLASMVGRGPMKHAVAGLIHLVVHRRPNRFGTSKPDAALLPLDLTNEHLGVNTSADFPWTQLVSFDSCVECGRCEVVCPAFAAGQPLNPKKLIQDLTATTLPAGVPIRYSGRSHPGLPIQQSAPGQSTPIIAGLIQPDTLWACTTCRACVQECPMMIEHVDAVIDLRRFQTLEAGLLPAKAALAIEELRAADNQWGRPAAARVEWATDLSLPLLLDDEGCDVLLWLGEGAFDLRNQRTLRALVLLLRRANVDFAVIGENELDCGDLARRLGDEATFCDLAKRNVALLARKRFKRILTVDPHVLHCLRNEYPSFGGTYEVVHHTTFLAELIETGRLDVKALNERVTYHDPCYLARYNGETDSPRKLLTLLGVNFIEMERSGMRSRCCGGGGGAPLTDIVGTRRIPDLRIDDARETGASIVAVACPNCMTMLEGVVGRRPAIRDVAELLVAGLGQA